MERTGMTGREFARLDDKRTYLRLAGKNEREEAVKISGQILELHKDIERKDLESGRDAYEIGKLFHRIKDTKWFKLLGFGTFRDYCTVQVEFTLRHVNRYIKVFDMLTEEQAANLGHTKAMMLAAGDDEKRQKLLDSGEVEKMSCREIMEAVRKERTVSKQDEREPVQLEMRWDMRLEENFGTGGRAIFKMHGDLGVAVSIGENGKCVLETVSMSDSQADEPIKLQDLEATRMLIGEYRRLWKEKYGTKPRFSGSDRANAVRLVRRFNCDMSVVFGLLAQYFENDKWGDDKSHPFWLFVTDYTVRRHLGNSTQKTRRAEHVQREKEAFDKEFREFQDRVRTSNVQGE